MASKREVLEQLKRDELVAALDRHGLEVRDRRVRGDLVVALAGSRKASLSEILGELSRARLKEICQALGLDDSGVKKVFLIERLTRQAQSRAKGQPASDDHQAPAPTVETPREASPAAAPSVSRATHGTAGTTGGSLRGVSTVEKISNGQLTREALERHLWSAADILRGSIDSSDYKNYILGLLFLKRLSDRFDEECEVVRNEGGDPEDPDEHQFYVPLLARWEELRKITTNVGEALNVATAELENRNPKLDGVLHGIDFNDDRRLGDVRQRDQVLGNLLVHFSKIGLRNANLSEPDMLGRAYEYLIERFADDAGKKGGEFYTPHEVVRLMVEILQPREGMRICDPTCGSGGMLIQCAQYVQRNGGDPRNLSLYGQEKNLGTWAICKMNMLLHGLPDARIEKGDTIREPKLVEDGALMQFDLVIANPPFSLDNWGREFAENDPWRRFRFGLPPRAKGDLAFVQHMAAILNQAGRMAVVMPQGVLFRGSTEGEIRRRLVEEDLVEAVIGLAPNLFYGTGIPATILLLNRAKAPERRGKVLFLDASREYREDSSQNHLRDEHVLRIAEAVHSLVAEPGYSQISSVDTVAKKDFNLTIGLYVEASEGPEALDLASAIASLRAAESARNAAKAVMDRYWEELGLGA